MELKRDRHWVVFRQAITTDMRQGAASKAIASYLEDVGYQQTQTSPSLIFARGNALAGLFNQNPADQQAEITVDVVGSGTGNSIIEVTLRVNGFGKLLLRPDVEFWEAELSGLSNAVRFGYADPRLSYFAAERARWVKIAGTLSLLLVSVAVLLLMVASMLVLAR